MSSRRGPQAVRRGLPQPGRTLVMGVVNVTPDSFSDGGRYVDPEAAVAHADLLAHGADLVDVGGESTRPGATRPSVDEELARVVPVVEELAAAGVPVSVDTMRAEVAEAAVGCWRVLVNDVSGGLADDAMLGTVARLDVPYVLMHWRGHSRDAAATDYGNVVDDVLAELRERLHEAARAGITHSIAIDPGHRLRQDRSAELGAAARPRAVPRARAPAARGHQPQALPRRTARGRRRRPPAGRAR
jgi:dihydropteroate synthase